MKLLNKLNFNCNTNHLLREGEIKEIKEMYGIIQFVRIKLT